MEAGKVFLPEGAPWLADYVDELCSFPTGVHDDAVDSTTQALNFLRHEQRHTVSIRQAFTGEYLGNRSGSFSHFAAHLKVVRAPVLPVSEKKAI